MEFLVYFPDGQTFGPADIPTLAQWAKEGRLMPQTVLENMATRERLPASSVAGIFSAQSAPVGQMGGPAPFAQQQPGYPRYDPRFQMQQYPVSAPINGMAITSLVCGIVSLVIFCVPFVAGIVGLMGVAFGFAGKKDSSTGIAIGGIVTGVLGTIISIIFTILVFTNNGNYWFKG